MKDSTVTTETIPEFHMGPEETKVVRSWFPAVFAYTDTAVQVRMCWLLHDIATSVMSGPNPAAATQNRAAERRGCDVPPGCSLLGGDGSKQ